MLWWLISTLGSAIFLLSIVLSIPIALDVGGRDAGLAFSLSLFLFYVLYSTSKLLTPARSRVRWTATQLVRLSQWVVIPTLLIWSLNRFSVDDARAGGWVSRTLARLTSSQRPGSSWHDWFFGQEGVLETIALGGWDSLLSYSSPVFQLLEGFCSLLLIQGAGQVTRWLVNRGRSDTWVIILLVFSGSVISSAVYFLWRVVRFPQIGNLDATLIGVAMTSAVFLCAFGIGSGRGNPVESSLLFAYMVLSIYQIFTDYQPSPEAAERAAAAAAAAASHQLEAHQEFPPLPPIIMASYTTLLAMVASLPSAVVSSLQFVYAAFQTITPSVIISLTYRIIVFYSATRIIPGVREAGAAPHALLVDDQPYLLDGHHSSSDTASRLLAFLSWFSPSVLIAVYTSLLLQHFSLAPEGGAAADDGLTGWTLRAGDAGGTTWRWVNIVATMGLYALELYLGGDGEEGLHWKTD